MFLCTVSTKRLILPLRSAMLIRTFDFPGTVFVFEKIKISLLLRNLSFKVEGQCSIQPCRSEPSTVPERSLFSRRSRSPCFYGSPSRRGRPVLGSATQIRTFDFPGRVFVFEKIKISLFLWISMDLQVRVKGQSSLLAIKMRCLSEL